MSCPHTFVKDEQLAPPHDSPSERDDLPLSDGQVPSTARDLGIERDAGVIRAFLQREEACRTKRVVEGGVVMRSEWVEILAQRSAQQLGLLQRRSEGVSHGMSG